MEYPTAEIIKKVLLNTKVFREPESDLRDVFHLKTSGKEAFLFASYGRCFSDIFYLHDEHYVLTALAEENVPSLLPPLLTIRREYLQEFGHAQPIEPKLNCSLNTPDMLERIFNEDKYMIILTPSYSHFRKNIADTTMRRYEKANIKSFVKQIDEVYDVCRKENIHPNNVLIYGLSNIGESENVAAGENFYEYLAGIVLREQNYFITKRHFGPIPVSDDIYAYKNDSFKNGAFAVEVGLGLKDLEVREGNTPEAVYIEAESTHENSISTFDEGIGQIRESMVYGHYSGYYVCGPFITKEEWENYEAGVIGAISFNEQGEIVFIPHKRCECEATKLTLINCMEYIQLLKKYAKGRRLLNFAIER